MLFSCLEDADYRDTELLYAKAVNDKGEREPSSLPGLIDEFRSAFDAAITVKQQDARDNPVNRLRREILSHVRGQADRPRACSC